MFKLGESVLMLYLSLFKFIFKLTNFNFLLTHRVLRFNSNDLRPLNLQIVDVLLKLLQATNILCNLHIQITFLLLLQFDSLHQCPVFINQHLVCQLNLSTITTLNFTFMVLLVCHSRLINFVFVTNWIVMFTDQMCRTLTSNRLLTELFFVWLFVLLYWSKLSFFALRVFLKGIRVSFNRGMWRVSNVLVIVGGRWVLNLVANKSFKFCETHVEIKITFMKLA